jgi:sodium/potassium/calcium exchanger 6
MTFHLTILLAPLVLAVPSTPFASPCSPPGKMNISDVCCQWEVSNITWEAVPDADQCRCSKVRVPDKGYVPYWRWHSCSLFCVPWISQAFAFLWLLFLFSVLASTADEYMVPVLEQLAEDLELSPNVAGVTILAFGNGGPEFFTLFAAFSSGNGAVAIGSLLGGGMFITTVVLGCVSMIAPFRPHRRPLLRDCGFYFAGVVSVWFATRDNIITLNEAVTLVVLYAVYVVVVVGSRLVNKRLLSGSQLEQRLTVRARGFLAGVKVRRRSLEGFAGRMNLRRYLRERGLDSSGSRPLRRSVSADDDTSDYPDGGAAGVGSINHSSDGVVRGVGRQSLDYWVSEANGNDDDDDDGGDDAANDDDDGGPSAFKPLMRPIRLPLLDRLEQSTGWSDKNALAKLCFPAELLLTVARQLTIPMPVDIDDGLRWKRRVNALSICGGAFAIPFFILADSDPLTRRVWPHVPLPLPAFAAAVAAVPACLVLILTRPDAPPRGLLGVALMLFSFFMSILWTNTIAGEIVAVLSFLGETLHIPQSVLGLTVLAWGNSIGDFVADTALARAGNPRMGAASCFGSPLFNMLIGFGASLTYATAKHGEFHLRPDRMTGLSFAFLIGSCALTGVLVPIRGFRLTRCYGGLLLVYYGTFLVCSLMFANHLL